MPQSSNGCRNGATPHEARAAHIAVIGKSRIHNGGKCNQRAFAGATAAIAQLGERQTEDLKVPGSIPGLGIFFCLQPLQITSRVTALQVSARQAAVDRNGLQIVTVAILAQGTSWAAADTQAFLPSGSIPMRIESQSANACPRSAASVVLFCARKLHVTTSTPCARNGLEPWVAHLTKHRDQTVWML